MFTPRGFALFGGIGTPGSFGQFILLSHIRYGYQGCLYPISPKGGEIAGLKVYKKLRDVKGPVDLASISVPARAVPGVLRDCLAQTVAGDRMHSYDFSKTAESGNLETEVIKIKEQVHEDICVEAEDSEISFELISFLQSC